MTRLTTQMVMIRHSITRLADRIGSDRGATAVEYGLMVALIAAVIIAAVMALGQTLNGVFTGVEGDISNAVGTGGGNNFTP